MKDAQASLPLWQPHGADYHEDKMSTEIFTTQSARMARNELRAHMRELESKLLSAAGGAGALTVLDLEDARDKIIAAFDKILGD